MCSRTAPEGGGVAREGVVSVRAAHVGVDTQCAVRQLLKVWHVRAWGMGSGRATQGMVAQQETHGTKAGLHLIEEECLTNQGAPAGQGRTPHSHLGTEVESLAVPVLDDAQFDDLVVDLLRGADHALEHLKCVNVWDGSME